MIRSTHNIGVRGTHFEVLFSVLNGGLVSYKYAGKEMIEAITLPFFATVTLQSNISVFTNRFLLMTFTLSALTSAVMF